MQKLAHRYKLPALLARAEHTGDNAAMIAFAKFIERDKIKSTSAPADALTIEPALRLDVT
jgi:tRNA A37 threonylcarbamoyltransferase TsaD